jgi:plastocyanin
MRLIYGSLTALALALVLAGCGGGGSSSSTAPTPTPTPTPTPSGTISIVGEQGNRSFNPSPASPASNGTMAFKNTDQQTHHIVANDGSWDTGNLAPGSTSAAVAIPAGGSNYHCLIHPSMVGVVNASAGTTPPCTGQYC